MSGYSKNIAEYRTTDDTYNAIRGDSLHEVVVGNRKYKVQIDKDGNLKKLSRYNEQYELWIEIGFDGTDSEIAKNMVIETLKGLYINRVLGLEE